MNGPLKMGVSLRALLVYALIFIITVSLVIAIPAVVLGDATVTVGNTTLEVGQSGSVPLWVLGIPESADGGMGCYDIDVYYDSSLVDVTGCGSGDAWWNDPSSCFDHPTAVPAYFSIVDVQPMCPGPDDGVDTKLCTIQFDCIGIGNNTFNPDVVDLGDCNMGDPIPYHEANGWCNQVPTPTPTPPPTPTPTPACFIATAAHGTSDSSVDTLRDFRDRYLINNPVGRCLVAAYYKLSPPVSTFIDEHPALKPVMRVGLLPAVAASAVALHTTLAQKIALVCGLVLVLSALTIWMRRRRLAG